MKNTRITSLSGACVLTLCLSAGAAAQDQMMINVKRMSSDTALAIAQKTLEACRKEGVQVAVTVVDRGGHTMVVLRDTLAMDLTLEISRQKAYTAMSFNTATSQLTDRFTHPFSVAKVQDVLPAAGGLPITAAGAILGGVGVSGAPSGETDEKCARVALDAIEADLEMGMM